jgi:hypothetical protein
MLFELALSIWLIIIVVKSRRSINQPNVARV